MPLSQPGVFNVLDSWDSSLGPMVPNKKTEAVNNAVRLQATIKAAQAYLAACPSGTPDYGATILIPSNDIVPFPVMGPGQGDGSIYYIAVPAGQSYAVEVNCNWPILFLGTGCATELQMIQNGTNPTGDMFFINADFGGDNDIGGVTFQDLQISYYAGAASAMGLPPPAAIHVGDPAMGSHNGGQNVRLFRVILIDCPIGVWFEQVLQGSMLECSALYRSNTGTVLQIGDNLGNAGKEIYVAGCLFRSGAGGTGIQIQGAEHVRVSDTHIDSFNYGIVINPGPAHHNSVRHAFDKVTIYSAAVGGASTSAGTALLIQPQGAQSVSDMTFVDCTFDPGASNPGTTGSGVLIDTSMTTGQVDTVRFISCYATRWPGAGIQITGGSNIEILGGMYSANGASSTSTGGIAITGAANAVRIVGATCIGSYPYIIIDGAPTTSPKQQYGIYIANGAQNVLVHGCDLTANVLAAAFIGKGGGAAPTGVFVRGCNATGYGSANPPPSFKFDMPGTVEITDCAGYNDQGATLSAPPTPPPMSGNTFHNYDFGYYGPVAFYIWGGSVTHTHIDGNDTMLQIGGFTLAPGERASLVYSAAPNFLVVGK